MKKITLYIIMIIGSSIILVYLLNQKERQNAESNAFSRKIENMKVQLVSVFELSDYTFAFSGKIDKNLKLNKYSDKLNLYEIDYSLKNLKTVKLKFPSSFNTQVVNIYKNTQESFTFCTNLYGDILRSYGQNLTYYKFNGFRFDYIQSISPSTIIVRGRYPHDKQNNRSIAKLTLSSSVISEKEYPLPNLTNGLFANDGRLLYDKENAIIFYMYYYRGEFLALDTNLNLLYKSKTIDTIHTAKIQTKTTKGEKEKISTTIQITPPKIINNFITTNYNKIYIISRLKSDNESDKKFSKNQIIDTYDIESGKYIDSFYVPKYLGKRLRYFQIKGNIMFAIYDRYLVKYRIGE